MKKTIFLIEDINESGVVTVAEKFFGGNTNRIKGRQVGWKEIINMLHHSNSDYITFKKVRDFMQEVNASKMPEDYDVYYFIACVNHIQDMDPILFYFLDYDVTTFLANNKIPVILDSTNEGNRTCNAAIHYIRDLRRKSFSIGFYEISKLIFYIVGGDQAVNLQPNGADPSEEDQFQEFSEWMDYDQGRINPDPNIIKYTSFPSTFFFQTCRGTNNYEIAVNDTENFIQRVRDFQIIETLPVWKAHVNTWKLNRIIFELFVEHRQLIQHGIFKRRNSRYDYFMGCYNRDRDYFHRKLPFLTDTMLDDLSICHDQKSLHDDIDVLPIYLDNFNLPSYGWAVPFRNDSMSFASLEVSWIEHEYPSRYQFENQRCSILTGNTSAPLLSGVPFIMVGSPKSSDLLQSFGLKEYHTIEHPTTNNFIANVEETVNKINYLCGLSIEQKKKLYEEWKPIIIHNYVQYLNIDIQYHYVKALNNAIQLNIASFQTN